MPDKYLQDVAEVFDDEGQQIASVDFAGSGTTQIVAGVAGKRLKVIAASFSTVPTAPADNRVAFRLGASSTNYFEMNTPDGVADSIFFNFGPSGWVITANTALSVWSRQASAAGTWATVVYKYID